MRTSVPFRAVVVVLAGVMALTALSVTPAAAATVTPKLSKWTHCKSDKTAWCAMLTVPVNWAKPTDTISLRVIKREATGTAAEKRGVLFVDWGGPDGTSASDLLNGPNGAPYKNFSKRLRKSFTLVGINEREIRVNCDDKLKTRLDGRALLPMTQAKYDSQRKLVADYAKSCRRYTKPSSLISHLNSAAVARDWDALRGLMKQKQVSYYGMSYGTVKGQTYARLFGPKVRAMVLDSNQDHALTTKDYLTSAAAGAEDFLNGFAAWCVAHPTTVNPDDGSCQALLSKVSKSGLPKTVAGIEDYFDKLYAAARKGTLRSDGSKLTSRALIGDFQEAQGWEDVPNMVSGYSERLAHMTITSTTSGGGSPEETISDTQTALRCADWPNLTDSYAELSATWKASKANAPHLRAHATHWRWILNCLGRPYPTGGNKPSSDPLSGVPLTVAAMRHDFATPYRWSEAVARRNDAPLLTYDGFGHIAYRSGRDCVSKALDAFLIDKTPVPDGTVCPGATTVP